MTEPKATVLIATHNRRQMLRRCLTALTQQTLSPGQFDVIVADDGSTDGSAQIAEELDVPYDLTVMRLEKRGKSSALNRAIEAAGAPLCVFIDDDVIASPTFVAGHLAGHESEPDCLGIGLLTQVPIRKRDWYARMFARAWNEHYVELERRPARWFDCYGANFSAPRAALLEVGGLKTDLAVTEDLELALRLWQTGCVPTYLPKARARHEDQKDRVRLLRGARRSGASRANLLEVHPEAMLELLNWGQVDHPWELAFRRLMISVRMSPRLLVPPGLALPGEGRRMIWLHIVHRIAFWQGVRRNMTRARWRSVINHSHTVSTRREEGEAAALFDQ